ncbi:MAG: Calcium-gated potassium channel MthK [Methanoregulaceae archaeon PtaB.Bin009]|jgi:CPA2 family monovalent cation:H+ antiporter-2|nr:MAG: Calcium-gated potassium channel MthK [Methanoregulaceae archaeon PtaB.Bin009]OPY41654.1 MAG: Calcium-gated potassium channel MthK [Methanoregulaceae archaeon PtaU1.Bin066]HNQ30055.1 monovalent cation:proton antiporter family protein [Methanolinea sp.]
MIEVDVFLFDILIVLGLSILVLFLGNKFRVPGIVGFILAGMLAGPYGLGLIQDQEIIQFLAEIGVIFLLFSIGMQFSFRTLYHMKKIVLLGGALQVGFTILVTAGLAYMLGFPLPSAIFLGFLICHTSTTITLRVFQDRGELDSPHSRTTLGISLFQDLMSVPMILLLPALSGHDIQPGEFAITVEVALVASLVLMLVLLFYLLPRLMDTITRTRSQELFLLTILFVCLAITWITSSIGLSLALGAFLAGLLLAETPYFHQAFATILPFRDIFTSFFFISIGMLLNAHILITHPLIVLGLIAGAIILKAVIAGLSSLSLGQSLRTSVLAGIALANIGEFSFVLILAGMEFAFLSDFSTQVFLTVAVWTMALSPFLISAGPRISGWICDLPLPQRIKAGSEPPPGTLPATHRDHLVIVGFGPNGRNLARVAEMEGIPYIVIDMNPDTVAEERKKGLPIFFGDAANPSILDHAGIEHARVLAIVTNDPFSSRTITAMAREMNPGIHILIRTRFLRDIDQLREIGADEVIVDEFETSIELISRVMKKYLAPRVTIDRATSRIREDMYRVFRQPPSDRGIFSEIALRIPQVEVQTFQVAERSPVAGHTLRELKVRTEFGVSVIAIGRNEDTIPNPDGEFRVDAGDRLVVIGKPDQLASFAAIVEMDGTGE